MTSDEKKHIDDPDLAKVEPALRRAAKRARKIARQTGTPLITYEDGRIVRTPGPEVNADEE